MSLQDLYIFNVTANDDAIKMEIEALTISQENLGYTGCPRFQFVSIYTLE